MEGFGPPLQGIEPASVRIERIIHLPGFTRTQFSESEWWEAKNLTSTFSFGNQGIFQFYILILALRGQ